MLTAPTATFTVAFAFVTEVSHHLEHGTRHFRNHEGRLLFTLDQVILAALADQLAPLPSLPHRSAPLMEADYQCWLASLEESA